MYSLIKSMIINIWPFLYKFMPRNRYTQGLNSKIVMNRLYIKDHVQWRVEKAKELGVKVGKDCRFYSANFMSEPYLVEIGDHVISF